MIVAIMVKVCVSLPQCVYMLPPYGQNYYYSKKKKKKKDWTRNEWIYFNGHDVDGKQPNMTENKHSLLLQVLTKEC